MLKHRVKQWIKGNETLYNILAFIIKLYLSAVYATIRWRYILPSGYSLDDFNKSAKTIFVMWHNNLAIAPYAFKQHRKLYVLVSPHADGKIISFTLKRFGYHIIEGSTNKNPSIAIRKILQELANKNNLAITPDGPRGPIYKINSNIVRIAQISNANIIPVSCRVEKYFKLNSWDGLMIPLPWSRGVVIIDEPFIFSENHQLSSEMLEGALNKLRLVGV